MKKNNLKIKSLMLAASFILVITLTSCKEDDPVADLILNSLTAGSIDLDGATSADNIPVDATITATFSSNVDESTVTTSTVVLTEGSTTVATTVTTSDAIITIAPTDELKPGTTYGIVIDNTVKSSDGGSFGGIDFAFKTEGKSFVTPPQEDNQVAYWNFDGNTNDFTGNQTTVFEEITYTDDRQGFANGAASFNGDGNIVEIAFNSNLINTNHTLNVWYKVDLADYDGSRFMLGMATERGFFNEIGGGLGWFKYATNHTVGNNPSNNGPFGTAWTDPNGDGQTNDQVLVDFEGSIADLVDGKWVMLTMTTDEAGMKNIYINGTIMMQVDLNNNVDWPLEGLALNDTDAAAVGLDSNFGIGWACSRTNAATGWSDYETDKNNNRTYKGLLDDLRIFDVALSQSDVSALYNAEK